MNFEGGKSQKLAFVAFGLLVLIIVSLGLMRPSIRLGGSSIQLTEVFFLLLLPLGVILGWRNRSSIEKDSAIYPVGFYSLAGFVATLSSPTIYNSLAKFAGVSYLVLLTLLVPIIVRERKDLDRIVATWIVVSTIVSVIGLIAAAHYLVFGSNSLSSGFLHGFGSLPVGNYPRIQSTFIYPAMLCNYLTVSVCLVLFARFQGRLVRTFWPILLVHVIAAGLTLTPGLGGFILALAIGACLFPIFERDLKRQFSVLAVGFFAVIGSVMLSAKSPWPINSGFYSAAGNIEYINVGPRLLTWIGALLTMMDHPFLGAGLGNSVTYVSFTTEAGKRILTDAHNSWLNFGAQAGIPGLIALIWLTVHFARRSVRAVWPVGRKLTYSAAFGAAFLSAFVAQGFVGSFEDARHLWVLFGLFIAAERLESFDKA